MDRPLLVMAWLHELLLQRQSEGGLLMPAPILSRVYAVRVCGWRGNPAVPCHSGLSFAIPHAVTPCAKPPHIKCLPVTWASPLLLLLLTCLAFCSVCLMA
jgi:hypothetical protein